MSRTYPFVFYPQLLRCRDACCFTYSGSGSCVRRQEPTWSRRSYLCRVKEVSGHWDRNELASLLCRTDSTGTHTRPPIPIDNLIEKNRPVNGSLSCTYFEKPKHLPDTEFFFRSSKSTTKEGRGKKWYKWIKSLVFDGRAFCCLYCFEGRRASNSRTIIWLEPLRCSSQEFDDRDKARSLLRSLERCYW